MLLTFQRRYFSSQLKQIQNFPYKFGNNYNNLITTRQSTDMKLLQKRLRFLVTESPIICLLTLRLIRLWIFQKIMWGTMSMWNLMSYHHLLLLRLIFLPMRWNSSTKVPRLLFFQIIYLCYSMPLELWKFRLNLITIISTSI